MAKSYEAIMLRSIRKQVGITQKEMANLFGLGVNQIYNWETDQTQMRAATLIMIVEYYNLDFTVLLNEARDEISPTSAR